MGRLAIVEEEDVSADASNIVPPNKKSRTKDGCGGNNLKTNQKSHHYLNEASGNRPKKHQSYKKTHQRQQRIQNQTSRKTKGISDESGYFEDEVDEEGNDCHLGNPAISYLNSPLTRENSPNLASLAAPQQQVSVNFPGEGNGLTHSIETASKDSRESIEIIYDRNAEMYEKNSRGVAHLLQPSHKYLSKPNVFHPKTSSLLKNELRKEQLDYGQNTNKTSEPLLRGHHQNMDVIASNMTTSTNLTSLSSVKPITTITSSSTMLPTATTNNQIQTSGKTS